MEPLRLDDPGRFGPYHVIGRLDPEYTTVPAPVRRYIARDAGGNRTVVVTAPPAAVADDPRYGTRFLAEAENARQLLQAQRLAWSWPVDEVGGGAGPAWHAAPYLPVLPLPSVVDLHGGPLPELTVRALGAALAEALALFHEAGHAHAGVAPGAVLVAGDGPRLTGFGAVRAAAEDGTPRTGSALLATEFLPPEQAAGGRPRPLGDVFALGAVLAWAATGLAAPEPRLLPDGLRDLVLACRAPDPGHRPAAAAVRDALLGGARMQAAGPGLPPVTSLDATADRATSLLGPDWLPGRVIAGIVSQSADVLAAEVDTGADEAVATAGVPAPRQGTTVDGTAHPATRLSSHGPGSDGSTRGPGRSGIQGGPAADTAPAVGRASARGADPARRALLLGAVTGVAGLAVGGGVVWAATAPAEHEPTAAERLVAARRTRRRLKGAPPVPRWRYDLKGAAAAHAPHVWRDRVAVVTGRTTVVGLDLRTGRQLWTREQLHPSGPAVSVGDDLVLIPGRTVAALSGRTGKVAWQDERYGRSGHTPFERLLAVDGSTVWFAAAPAGGERVVVAYDVDHHKELWRSPLPSAAGGGQLTDNELIVTAGAEGGGDLKSFAFSRADGAGHDPVSYDGVAAGADFAVDGKGTLLVAAGKYLRGYSVSDGGKAEWSVHAMRRTEQNSIPAFGPVSVHRGTVYAADGGYAVHALATSTGRVVWQRQYGFRLPEWPDVRSPDVVAGPSGDTLVMADDYEVDALDARDGTLRWRFADLRGGGRAPGGPARRTVAVTDDTAVVLSDRAVYGLPLA